MITDNDNIPGGDRAQRIRAAIRQFLDERLQAKVDKLPPDDPKRAGLTAQFRPAVWLEDAARRVRQIQAVTHSLKPIHPDARGTSIYREPAQLPPHDLLGSHALGPDFAADVVGNAAALDVYKFLRLQVDDRSLLDWFLAGDAQAIRALDDDPQRAQQWRDAFVSLTQPSSSAASSHTFAKQLYWLTGDDASDDAQYHLLAPLYATSLAHAVYQTVQEDRFGEASKAARQARREGRMHDGVLHEYPALAVQKLGGTKPQNISQLNSERGGNNYLLASLPPVWQSRALPDRWKVTSVFERMFGARSGVRSTVRALLKFLQSDPPANMHTRNRRDVYIDRLIDELVLMARELRRAWPANWTADARCQLPFAEQLWLDHMRAESDEDFCSAWVWMDWPDEIGHRFGNWLNTLLKGTLPVGDVEQRQWKNELLLDEDIEGWAQHLHRMRADLGVSKPPVRKEREEA